MADETTSKEPTAEGGEKAAMTKRAYNKKTPKKASKKMSKKAAMKAPKGKGSTGKRYNQEFKDKVIAHVQANPGRGIVSEAMEKFGVSYISLRNWLKKEGVQVKKVVKDAVKNVSGKGRGRPKISSKGSSSKGGDTFENLVAEIRETKAKLKDLVARLAGAV